MAPHRARQKPFVFTTSGSVAGPSWIPSAYACSGQVTVKSFFGGRLVGFSVAPVQPNCTFSTRTIFDFLPTRNKKHRQVHMRVVIHFRGNGYLAPAEARPEMITAG